MDHVQKDLGEYFYRDKVGLVRGQRPMDFVTSQQMMAFVDSGSGRDDGGCAIKCQANVAGVEGRAITVRIHGG